MPKTPRPTPTKSPRITPTKDQAQAYAKYESESHAYDCRKMNNLKQNKGR